MYTVVISHRYKTALKRISRHKHFDRITLELVVNLLARNASLPSNYKDHALTGKFKEYRECHLKNDLLLMYQIIDNELILLLVDIGTHSDLFP